MTLQTQHTTNAPATLSDEQRRRVADALENAQSENTRRNYAGQYRKFRAWCEREEQSALPAQPEVVAAYAAELADDGKSMSTIRLAVAAIVDAHRSVGLESPQTTGVTETLRGLSRQVGVSQKQARPLDADALAAIRATALNPRKSRGGLLEMEDTALRRGLAYLRGCQSQVARRARCRGWRRTGVHRVLEDRSGGRGSIRRGHARHSGGHEAAAARL